VKGVIFNLLEGVVTEELGEDAWDEVLAQTGVDGAYTALGTYPHEELFSLVNVAGPQLGMTTDETVRWFGRRALGMLAERYPQLFSPHASTTGFLLTLNNIIHPEVRKLYPGADVPVFDYRITEADRVVMGYHSARGLCSFGEGLIDGSAEHFGESAAVEQTSCVKRGDPECVFDVKVSR